MSCFLNCTYKTKLLITSQDLKRIEQFTAYIIRIHVAKRCRKLWIAKLFADGKAVSTQIMAMRTVSGKFISKAKCRKEV